MYSSHAATMRRPLDAMSGRLDCAPPSRAGDVHVRPASDDVVVNAPTASPPLAVQTTAVRFLPSSPPDATPPPTCGHAVTSQPNLPTGADFSQVRPPSGEVISAMSRGSRSRYRTWTTPPGSVSRLFQQHSQHCGSSVTFADHVRPPSLERA